MTHRNLHGPGDKKIDNDGTTERLKLKERQRKIQTGGPRLRMSEIRPGSKITGV